MEPHPITSAASQVRSRLRIAIALLWLLIPAAHAESEYNVKAAFLYNFTRLVKWPATAFATPQAPLVIGVVGRDPFSGGLNDILRGQKAGARPIEVKHLGTGDSAGLQNCHLIFVSSSVNVAEVARVVQGRPVLVVGESENFARTGGIIGFVVREQKIRLEINNDAARQMRLGIPSDLLAMAKIVN